MDTILVTGGAGFIGSAVVRRLVRDGKRVINLDKLTYAGNPESLKTIENATNHRLVEGDILDGELVLSLLREERVDGIMHLAAESHVDRSIDGPGAFVETNVVGTFRLLDAALEYWRGLDGAKKEGFRFHHISTDEVFGDLDFDDSLFSEETPYAPSSPYSASKAASDHFVRAWHETYGLPVVLSNCSNNYVPYHFPEKLVPLMIAKALDGEPLPVYGKGDQVRDWLFVEDHVRALQAVFERGELGRYPSSWRTTRTCSRICVSCRSIGRTSTRLARASVRVARALESVRANGIERSLANGDVERAVREIISHFFRRVLYTGPHTTALAW